MKVNCQIILYCPSLYYVNLNIHKPIIFIIEVEFLLTICENRNNLTNSFDSVERKCYNGDI